MFVGFVCCVCVVPNHLAEGEDLWCGEAQLHLICVLLFLYVLYFVFSTFEKVGWGPGGIASIAACCAHGAPPIAIARGGGYEGASEHEHV